MNGWGNPCPKAKAKLQKQHDKMSSADNNQTKPEKKLPTKQLHKCDELTETVPPQRPPVPFFFLTPINPPPPSRPVNKPRMRHVSAASSSPVTDFSALLTSPTQQKQQKKCNKNKEQLLAVNAVKALDFNTRLGRN